jgi:hypothetical protein
MMAGDRQDPSQTDLEGEGGASGPELKQETFKGHEIPVLKRDSIFAAFKKIIQPITKR